MNSVQNACLHACYFGKCPKGHYALRAVSAIVRTSLLRGVLAKTMWAPGFPRARIRSRQTSKHATEAAENALYASVS